MNGLEWPARPVSSLKGIGPKRAALLKKKGLHTLLDLLFFFPIRYEDRREISPIAGVRPGCPALVAGRVRFGKEETFFPSRKRLFRIVIEDAAGTLDLLWFHYRRPHLNALAVPGRRLLVYGTVKENTGKKQMLHPDAAPFSEDLEQGRVPGYVPVYSFIKGVSNLQLGKMVQGALEGLDRDTEGFLPPGVLRKLALPNLAESLHFIHRPAAACPQEDLRVCRTPYHRRLLFDRFFIVMAALARLRKIRANRPAPSLPAPPDLEGALGRIFPFPLTGAQIRSVRDIAGDMAGASPMNRLLLGDVGCGKTVVALAAAVVAAYNHKQTALLVPTQILARQHMEVITGLPPAAGLKPLLITGTLSAQERRTCRQALREGRANLVVGTHALLQKDMEFSNLGLVIVDEQHRFGIRERSALLEKGNNPHQLVISATPIPRTLAMTLYGDMDTSLIDAYPGGRPPVRTRLLPRSRNREVFEAVKNALEKGEQCFVICPRIYDSGEEELQGVLDMAARLERLLSPAYRVGLIHGRMDPEKREAVMEHFYSGHIHLLVGTAILEVGIHVPNATVMVIEHPERFGLAQLHQLRGRVGRGGSPGACFLIAPEDLSPEVMERLEVMVSHQDGFRIAQADMARRGHGEFTGLRQAGAGEFSIDEVLFEKDLLFQAREAALELLEGDPDLRQPANRACRDAVDSLLTGPLDL